MSTLSVDTIQGKTTAGTVKMPAGHIVQVVSAEGSTQANVSGTNGLSAGPITVTNATITVNGVYTIV